MKQSDHRLGGFAERQAPETHGPGCASGNTASNVLNISPKWDFTRSRSGGRTTFNFHSAGECPGYVVTVSDWRLRRETCCPESPSANLVDIALDALQELKRTLGEDAFAEVERVRESSSEKVKAIAKNCMRAGPHFLSPRRIIQAASDAATVEIGGALLRAMFSPRVIYLSTPLLTLIWRDKARWVVEKQPWPYREPPCTLSHLATTGFASRMPWGILAVHKGSADVWIVSRFAECEVDLSWNREDALRREFPALFAVTTRRKIDASRRNARKGGRNPPDEAIMKPAREDLQARLKNGTTWQMACRRVLDGHRLTSKERVARIEMTIPGLKKHAKQHGVKKPRKRLPRV